MGSIRRKIGAVLLSCATIAGLIVAPSAGANTQVVSMQNEPTIDTAVGAHNNFPVLVPAGLTGTLQIYNDGVPGQIVDVDTTGGEQVYRLGADTVSYGPHEITIRFADELGQNPYPDITRSFTTPAPDREAFRQSTGYTDLRFGSGDDYESYSLSMRVNRNTGQESSGDGSYQNPYIVGAGTRIYYQADITVGAHSAKDVTGRTKYLFGEQGFMLPEGFAPEDSSIRYAVNGSGRNFYICTSGADFDSAKCTGGGLVGGYVKPDWSKALSPVPASYRGIQTTRPAISGGYSEAVGNVITVSEYANVTENLAPGNYPTLVAMSKYDRNAVTSIIPMETGWVRFEPTPLPERVMPAGESGQDSSATTEASAAVTPAASATAEASSQETGTGAVVTTTFYKDEVVYEFPKASTITRRSAIDATCKSVGAPMGRDSSQLSRVQLISTYPNYAVEGQEFDLTVAPQVQNADAGTDGADFLTMYRLKVDFKVPDPQLVDLLGVTVNNDGTGYQGTPSLMRIDASGNPDPNGEFIRLSDDNLTIGNGPRSGDDVTGLRVPINGRATPYRLPSMVFHLKVKDTLPESTQGLAYLSSQVRNDAESMQEKNPSNFITFGMQIRVAGMANSNLKIYCQPDAKDAQRDIFRVTLSNKDRFKKVKKVPVVTTIAAGEDAAKIAAEQGLSTEPASVGTESTQSSEAMEDDLNRFQNAVDSQNDDVQEERAPLPSNTTVYDNSLIGTILRKLGGTTKGFAILAAIIALLAAGLGAAGLKAAQDQQLI